MNVEAGSDDRALGASLERIRAQVLERVASEPAPTRTQAAWRRRVVYAASALGSIGVFVAAGGVGAGPRPTELLIESAVGASVIAVGAAVLALRRGRSMLGRKGSWLAFVVLVTPALLFAWKVLVSSRYPDAMGEWSNRPGLHCLALSASFAFLPLLGYLWLRRGSDPTHPHLAAGAAGAAVGALAWVLVDLWCPVGYVPHLLLGHVLPLLLVIAASIAIGGRLLAVRARPRRSSR